MKTKLANIWSLVGACVLSLVTFSSVWGIPMCTLYSSEGPTWVYEDALVTGWSVAGGWNSTTITNASGVGQIGPSAIRVTYQTTWSGTGLYKAGNADLSQVTGLEFRVRMEQSGDLQVGIHRQVTNTVDKWVSTAQYINPFQSTLIVPGQWYRVYIPLTELQLSSGDNLIKGFVFMSSVPGTVYVDNVRFLSAFLKFPLDCSTPNANCSGGLDYRVTGAYTALSVTSALDHSMIIVYKVPDGTVLAWSGEKGVGTPVSLGCYPKVGGGSFSLGGTYVGTNDGCTPSGGLNYDNHPAYDYKASLNTPVKAAAAGTVVTYTTGERCIPKGLEEGCAEWGAVGIDHGNGYITQYLHLGSISVVAGQYVTEGSTIGLSGNTTPPTKPLGPHLHFEVLRKIPGSSSALESYKVVDPYGWAGVGADPLEVTTGQTNFRLWK